MMAITTQQVQQGLTLLERLAVSNEKIVEMANEERQANYQGGPPYCPHCGTFGPNITTQGRGGSFADYVLVAVCENCNNTFIGQPEGWQVFRTPQEYEAAKLP